MAELNPRPDQELTVFIRLIQITAALFLSIVLVSPPLKAQSPGEFKIGAILALTGPAQTWGKYARLGAQLALEEQNALGGLNGRRIAITFEDSRSSGAGAVGAFKKLTTLDKVDVLLADVWTQFVDPLIPLSTAQKITLIAPTVVPVSVKPGPYFFTLGFDPNRAAGAVAKFFETNPGIKSAAIFCWDNPWGASYLKVWKSEMSQRGIRITNEICTNDFGYDYRADVAKLALSKPDAIIVSHQAERILQRVAEVQLAPLVLSTSNIVEVFSDKTLPPALAEGVYFTDWVPSAEFKAKFEAKYGTAPILEAHNSYEALRAIFKAYAGNPRALRAGFDTLHYAGVAGPLDFTGGFDANKANASLCRIVKGSIRVEH